MKYGIKLVKRNAPPQKREYLFLLSALENLTRESYDQSIARQSEHVSSVVRYSAHE